MLHSTNLHQVLILLHVILCLPGPSGDDNRTKTDQAAKAEPPTMSHPIHMMPSASLGLLIQQTQSLLGPGQLPGQQEKFPSFFGAGSQQQQSPFEAGQDLMSSPVERVQFGLQSLQPSQSPFSSPPHPSPVQQTTGGVPSAIAGTSTEVTTIFSLPAHKIFGELLS